MKKKAATFVPSTDFVAKQKRHEKNVMTTLNKEFVKELQTLKSDNFSDVDVFVENENMHLRHKSILRTVAPTFYSNLGLTFDSNITFMNLTEFQSNVPESERNILKVIYGSNHVEEEDMKINLTVLLDNGAESDVTLKVNDDMFKCHKCILSARSEFFLLMFGGNWMETNIDVVPLKNISAETFRIILRVIYNGGLEIPANADVAELIEGSERYQINCLKKTLHYHLKTNYCHLFHMPCQFCITGVLDTIYMCNNFLAFEVLIQECYKWLLRYYAKIFVSRQFAKSTQLIKDNISDRIRESVSVTNFLQHMQDCIQVKARLPQVKTVEIESIKVMVSGIEEYCLEFVSKNFKDVIGYPAFLYSFYGNKDVNKNLMLQEFLIAGLSKYLTYSNCTDIYVAALNIEIITNKLDKAERNEATENCEKFYNNLKDLSKTYIHRNYIKIKRTSGWKDLSVTIQKEIMENSGFVDI